MKRKLLLFGLITALLMYAGLVFARNYTTIKRLVITVDDVPANGENNIRNVNISANGRYLVYESYFNHIYDTGLFLYDLQTDQRQYVGSGLWAWVSDDGRYVLADASAPSPNYNGVILYDLVEKTETIVGTGLNGEPLEGHVWAGTMSPDGRYVLYFTKATNPFDGEYTSCEDLESDWECSGVFLWDRQTNTQERISVNNQGEAAIGESGLASISHDARYVIFVSNATDLTSEAPPCIDEACYHIYIRDRVAGITELVNIDPSGSVVFDAVVYVTLSHFDLSGNGRYVVFGGDSNPAPDVSDTNLYVRDILNDTTEIVNLDSSGNRIPNSRNAGFNVMSYDGRFVMFIGGDNVLYVRDRINRITTVASRDGNGTVGTISDYAFLSPASISASGDTIVFESESDTLIGATPGDTSEKIFVSQGEAIPPTSTPTDVPHTATAQPTDTASTATPQPSTTPSCEQPTELLLNGGFEVAGNTANSATNWQEKRLVRSKRVQNKPDKTVAHSGDFAFQFKGSGKITQTVNSISGCGDVLTLSAWVEGKKLDAARVQAKVIYANADPVKLRLSNEELNAGTYAYKPLSATLNLSGDIESIKVQISKRNSTGRLRIDDVSLSLSADAARITLPIAQ